MSNPNLLMAWKSWTVLLVGLLLGGQAASLDRRIFSPRVDYDLLPGERPTELIAADLDGDLDLDLITANGDVTVLSNDGSGNFMDRSTVAAGPSATALDASDLDLDGDLDLVVALYGLPGGVAILENTGATFVRVAILAAGNRPSGVVCRDLDLDGMPDIAVSNFASGLCASGDDGEATGLRNEGGMRFADPVGYRVGCAPWSIACGDLDGINGPDLVVANDQSISVSVLLNDGSGGFARQVPYYVGGGARDVECCDLDGDGHSDLVVGNRSDSVAVLWGNGTGRFPPVSLYPVGTAAGAVACGDLDCDGFVDVAIANGRPPGGVTVLVNDGARTFSTRHVFGVDGDPRSIVVADLDPTLLGLDAATANTNSGTVSVLRNQNREVPISICAAGAVDAACGRDGDVLFLNDAIGGADRTIEVAGTTPLTATLAEPPGHRGDGQPTRACLYAWVGFPTRADIVLVPRGLGWMCFGPFALSTESPDRTWNAIGS